MKKKVLKKAEMGMGPKTKPMAKKKFPIISESGDLADVLNETLVKKKPMSESTLMKRVGEAQKKVPMPKKMHGGKMHKKAKDGGNFPDLNKDGKVTKADVLVGRGVIKAKKGAALKKQAAVAIAMKKAGKTPKTMKSGGKCRYGCK